MAKAPGERVDPATVRPDHTAGCRIVVPGLAGMGSPGSNYAEQPMYRFWVTSNVTDCLSAARRF
jgi:hypothetical protein